MQADVFSYSRQRSANPSSNPGQGVFSLLGGKSQLFLRKSFDMSCLFKTKAFLVLILPALRCSLIENRNQSKSKYAVSALLGGVRLNPHTVEMSPRKHSIFLLMSWFSTMGIVRINVQCN